MELEDSTIVSIGEEVKLLQQMPPPDDKIEPQQQRDSRLAASIEQEMNQKYPLDSKKCSIYRVPKRLLDRNLKAYTPQFISIGPFHHGKQHLMAMERHKLRGLSIYLRRITMSTEDAIATARKWETEARGFYAEPIKMNQDKFVKMMLVDGCFLLEFMLLVYNGFSSLNQSLTLDPSFFGSIGNHLCYDLIMLENQLPLIVLENLYRILLSTLKVDIPTFDVLIQNFIEYEYIGPSDEHPQWDIKAKSANHLVHLLSDYYNPTSLHVVSQSGDPSKVEGTRNFQCSLSVFSCLCSLSSNKKGNDENIEQKKFLAPPTLTELWEAGVTIKKSGKEKHSMEISFKDGVLEIPPFEIHDHFETRVRNVMAFEYYHLGRSKRYVTNYIIFLDDLINTEKDVSLLVEAEILRNNIGGSYKEVFKLFNDLCKEVAYRDIKNYYSNTTEALSKYCKATRHRWMASLRRDYFNSPWASISFFAATFLLILTFLQTLYSHLSYFN